METPTNEPSVNELKMRVLEARKKLPKSGVNSFFLKLFPVYDTEANRVKLNNVLQSRSTDLEITQKLERMAVIVEENTEKLTE